MEVAIESPAPNCGDARRKERESKRPFEAPGNGSDIKVQRAKQQPVDV